MDITSTIPEELLIEIFEYLPKLDRLTCQTVCHRWQNILMNAACFKTDRTLHLNNCVIDIECPPASTFLESSREYQTLCVSNLERIDQNAINFWKCLGENIIELKFFQVGPFYEEYLPMFKYLLNVKTLHLHNMIESCDFFAQYYVELKEFFSNIEEIHFGCHAQDLQRAHELIQMMPNLRKIYCPIFNTIQNKSNWMDLLDYYLEHAQKLKFLSINLDDWKMETAGEWHDTEIEELMLDVLKRCKLEGLSYESKHDFEFLKKITETQPKLKTIKIKCNVFPSSNFTQITNLDVMLLKKTETFKPLVQLKHLKNLYLDFAWSQESMIKDCFFGHEVLDLSHIRKLFINTKSHLCQSCMEFFIRSVSFLDSLAITTQTIEIFELKLIFGTIKTLQKFHLLVISNVAVSMHDLLTIENSYSEMKDLVLSGLEEITKDDINAICNAFPNLKYLTIRSEFWDFESLDIVYGSIFRQLKHIRQFDPRLTRFDSFIRPTKTTLEVIGDLATNVRVLHLPDNRIPLKEKLKLFETLENLQLILQDYVTEITRADYNDVFVRKATLLKDLIRYFDAKKRESLNYI